MSKLSLVQILARLQRMTQVFLDVQAGVVEFTFFEKQVTTFGPEEEASKDGIGDC